MSVAAVGAGGHGDGQPGVDVRVRPRGIGPPRVVGPDLLLPARLPRRRAALPLRLGAGGQLHHVAAREAALQPDAVLLGRLRPRRRPVLAPAADDVLPRAAFARLAALLRPQRLARHEPDGALARTGGHQEPHVRLLGQTGHLLETNRAEPGGTVARWHGGGVGAVLLGTYAALAAHL